MTPWQGEVAGTTARAAETLASDLRVQLVYMFGSAVDSPTPGDLDLAIWADPPLAPDELMRRRADLVLALKVPVDLVSWNHASIVLAHEVVEYGRCLYARNPEIETDVVTRTRARYWDFKPYRDETQG